jgi:hypothetical protein
MTFEEASAILGPYGVETENAGYMMWDNFGFLGWRPGEDTATVDDNFTPDQLEALATFMRLYRKAE